MKSIYFLITTTILIGIFSFIKPRPSKIPAKNEVELGRQLFFDPILSSNHKISCASCHKPEFAFADNVAFSVGVKGKKTLRNTPSIMNMADRPYLFWDGRSPNLEDQAIHPILNPKEMGMNMQTTLKRLNKNKYYLQSFLNIYQSKITSVLIGKAIAAYERTLETGNTPFDRYIDGELNSISEDAINGRDIFLNKGRCFDCHFTPDFTGDEFKNIGIFNGKKFNDSGRYSVTKNPDDIGKFKVPGLRNITLTAPYMHNGMFKTLEQVVEYYNNPDLFIPDAIGRDTTFIKPLGLTMKEKQNLVSFLHTLTPDKTKNN